MLYIGIVKISLMIGEEDKRKI